MVFPSRLRREDAAPPAVGEGKDDRIYLVRVGVHHRARWARRNGAAHPSAAAVRVPLQETALRWVKGYVPSHNSIWRIGRVEKRFRCDSTRAAQVPTLVLGVA